MKTEDEVFSKFLELKALVGKQTYKKSEVLRSNNGGEYTSKQLDPFCKEEKIKRDLTVS
jgi:hypothetical protein